MSTNNLMEQGTYDHIKRMLEIEQWHYDLETGIVIGRQGGVGYVSRWGYLQFSTNKKGLVRTVMGHQIIAVAGGLDPVGFTLNHIDGVKTNNKLSNLEVLSIGDNVRHAYATGLIERS